MDYTQATELLFNSLPVFQLSGGGAYKPGIERILALDEKLGNPHSRYQTIHVAGTNGKGSVSHTLASVLMESGLSVGLYTSPHLKDFRERMSVNGAVISEQEVVEFVENNIDYAKALGASFFELTASMAFEFFARNDVDVAVIEVGLGGRLDATNIISPILSIITNIGIDHTQFLGSTLEEIATEKAGIIKPKVPVVIGQGGDEIDHVFENKAERYNAPIIFAEDVFEIEEQLALEDSQSIVLRRLSGSVPCRKYKLELDLMGEYQAHNIRTVVTAIETLNQYCRFDISTDDIEQGVANAVANTSLKGRWQRLAKIPLTICDTGHNTHGIKEIVAQIEKQNFDKLYFVIGMVSDKDISSVLEILPTYPYYIFTQADNTRSLPADELMSMAAKYGLKGECVKDVSQAYALARALARYNDMIFIGGSNFVVAQVL